MNKRLESLAVLALSLSFAVFMTIEGYHIITVAFAAITKTIGG